MQNLSCKNEFYLHDKKRKFSQERFCTWPRFKKETCGSLSSTEAPLSECRRRKESGGGLLRLQSPCKADSITNAPLNLCGGERACGISEMAQSLAYIKLSRPSFCQRNERPPTPRFAVFVQWTTRAQLFNASNFVLQTFNPKM